VTVHLTPAQARKLGIHTSGPNVVDPDTLTPPPPGPAPGARRRATPYHTVCVLCRSHFTTQAAEDRHLEATGHPRYALVIEPAKKKP
jgi:hypothetical protein